MHGRRKVKREEIDEAKRKAREKKAKGYAALCEQILDAREKGILTPEILKLTQGVAELNPEFYTVWNYRRDILEVLLSDMSEEERIKTLEGERTLTETGLLVNPKSYWVWNHRRWTVQQLPSPWEFELKCCAKFLNADQRNFHCWNYRRWAAQQGGLTVEQDFDFTTEKIEQNFSNYSAWHQRASDLLLTSRDTGRQGFSNEEREARVAKEFEFVTQAFYTEPDDQSAWFYHRWLVSRVKTHGVRDEQSPVATINQHRAGDIGLSVAFVKPIDNPDDYITVSGVGKWTAADVHQTVWHRHTTNPDDTVTWKLGTPVAGDEKSTQDLTNITSEYSTILEREAGMVDELADLEPDSKWVMLTQMFLAIQNRKPAEEVASLVARLIELDPMRRMHFSDISGVHALDMKTAQVEVSGDGHADLSSSHLSGHGVDGRLLHRLNNSASAVTKLNLSGNALTSISNIEALHTLTEIDVRDNDLVTLDVEALANALPSLSKIYVRGNNRLDVSALPSTRVTVDSES